MLLLNVLYVFKCLGRVFINKFSFMDIRDFEGLFKFKLIVPGLYVLSWICIFLGPSLFPVVYQRYFIGLWLFMFIKMIYMLFNMVLILWRTYSTLKGYQAPPSPVSQSIPEIESYRSITPCNRYYAWVIPNYK